MACGLKGPCYTLAKAVTEPGVEIPKRALFKASDVCEIARVQPYVLRSWEAEFPRLGVARTPGGPRVYRRVDVERVLQIKQLVYGEGLTLSGARRRIEGTETATQAEPTVADLLDDETRRRLADVKQGLRSLLEMLSSGQPEWSLVAERGPRKGSAVGVGGASEAEGTKAHRGTSGSRGAKRPASRGSRKSESARK
jgi:DNA-binding transcriptional MerR regulator